MEELIKKLDITDRKSTFNAYREYESLRKRKNKKQEEYQRMSILHSQYLKARALARAEKKVEDARKTDAADEAEWRSKLLPRNKGDFSIIGGLNAFSCNMKPYKFLQTRRPPSFNSWQHESQQFFKENSRHNLDSIGVDVCYDLCNFYLPHEWWLLPGPRPAKRQDNIHAPSVTYTHQCMLCLKLFTSYPECSYHMTMCYAQLRAPPSLLEAYFDERRAYLSSVGLSYWNRDGTINKRVWLSTQRTKDALRHKYSYQCLFCKEEFSVVPVQYFNPEPKTLVMRRWRESYREEWIHSPPKHPPYPTGVMRDVFEDPAKVNEDGTWTSAKECIRNTAEPSFQLEFWFLFEHVMKCRVRFGDNHACPSQKEGLILPNTRYPEEYVETCECERISEELYESYAAATNSHVLASDCGPYSSLYFTAAASGSWHSLRNDVRWHCRPCKYDSTTEKAWKEQLQMMWSNEEDEDCRLVCKQLYSPDGVYALSELGLKYNEQGYNGRGHHIGERGVYRPLPKGSGAKGCWCYLRLNEYSMRRLLDNLPAEYYSDSDEEE